MHARSGQSSYRDRTHEFLTVAERLRKSSALNVQDSNLGSKFEGTKAAVFIQSEFKKKASKIGFGIFQTSQKLAKLAILAKRTSVFDDPAVEIQEMTSIIKQDITALNSAVVDLQLLCSSQNDSSNISRDTSSHSATVVDDLKNRLMSATKEFKDVLTLRTENMKVHDNRRQLFSSSTSKDPSNPFIRQRPLISKVPSSSVAPPAPWASELESTSQSFFRKKTNGDPSSSSSSSSQPSIHQQQVYQQPESTVAAQDTYMQNRAEALQNVESTIHELSNIFTQLATMVSQQGELAIRIDENMDDTLANVEGAQGQLLKYLNSISSNRWLMLKIFFVLIVFLTIFVFFVA